MFGLSRRGMIGEPPARSLAEYLAERPDRVKELVGEAAGAAQYRVATERENQHAVTTG